jgi:hypothetical protein
MRRVKGIILGSAVVALALPLFHMQQAAADAPPPQFVHFSGHAQGALYLPDPAVYPDPKVGVVVAHRDSNYMVHISTRELPPRGFPVLGFNTHAANNEGAIDWDGGIPLDVRSAVEYMKNVVGMEKVILLAHSGGGPTMSYYQAIAENGLDICRGPGKIVSCPDNEALVGPRADATIYMDSHPGNTVNILRRLNPAVVSESEPKRLNSDLNPFLKRNGYNPNGCSSYSEKFKERYFEAQANRMRRLTNYALSVKAKIDAGRHIPTDNDVFTAYHIEARLYDLDNTIDGATMKRRKLLGDDRSIQTKIVKTVRPCGEPLGYSTPESDATLGRANEMNVNMFLGIWAIRALDSMENIDYCSSNSTTSCNVQHIKSPALFVTAQGNPYMVDNEKLYELSASSIKDFVVIEGSTHGFGNCGACTGGPYHNVTKNTFDYMAAWINGGFTPVSELP